MPPIPQKTISIDCETTGVDHFHGARPFFVTICRDVKEPPLYWEWPVDPLTRQPVVPDGDLDEVRAELGKASEFVGQNAKFDVRALETVGLWTGNLLERFWAGLRDTLIAAHLLASNQPHDLTALAMQYLGVDIEPAEKSLKAAVQEARRLARARFPQWLIAKEGLAGMPSASASTGSYDYWLPKALAAELGYPADHAWQTVLRDYALADSQVTLALWQVMEAEVRRRGLWAILAERLKLPRVAHAIERHGVTVSRERLGELEKEYARDSAEAGRVCVSIADSVGCQLELPRSGNNGSMSRLAFGCLWGVCGACKHEQEVFAKKVECPKCLKRKRGGGGVRIMEVAERKGLALPPLKRSAKTGKPSLDKETLERWEHELPPRSLALAFVKALRGKRKRDTALSYLEGYRRYWLPIHEFVDNSDPQAALAEVMGEQVWFRLHPSLNITGTDTLRWSSSNPNSQNFSKQGMDEDSRSLRWCLGPAPGREWWSLDAKNIELRLPAYLSEERELIELFERPDEPPYFGSTHLLNFHTVYPDIWNKELAEVGEDEVGAHCKKKYASTWYQWCKNGGFAIQYGAMQETSDRSFHKAGSYRRLKQRFSKLEALNQSCIKQAEKFGYVETIPDKTVDPERGYPLLCTRTEYGSILPTVPLNYKIQGSAMWWMAKAMVRVQEFFDRLNDGAEFAGKTWPGGYHLIMQVHDELVLDFPQKDLTGGGGNLEVAREVKRLMEQGGEDLGIPTPCSMEHHAVSWSEGTSY